MRRHPCPRRIVAAALLAAVALMSSSTAQAAPTTRPEPTVAPPPTSFVLEAVAGAPKNVIILIGDGMGYASVDLASAYQFGTTYHQVSVTPATGAVAHLPGTASQVYQSFPVQVGSSTYSAGGRAGYDPGAAWQSFAWVASGATDSAAAGTALATGTKTINGRLGIAPNGSVLENVMQRADALGKATGVVTSVPFSHATPAAFAAHNVDRNDFAGVTHEYLEADYLDVIIGGGHPHYDDSHGLRSTPAYNFVSAADWRRLVDGATGFTLVERFEDFAAMAAGTLTPDRLFGVVQVGSTLQQGRAGLSTAAEPFAAPRNDVPDLPTLARGALTVLERDADGFLLMVEGGAIDWAGHANAAVAVVEETVDFNRTVEAVVAWVEAESSWAETLVVVTADHETGYLAGPDADPTWTTLTALQGGVAPHTWHSSGHTNQLVPLYAKGAGSGQLAARATGLDPVRGAYLDNTDFGKALLSELWPRPVGTADPVARYVTSVYRDLFGRPPDPAGLAAWTALLNQGADRAMVARSITASTEYRSRLIAGAYREFLGREPDAVGLTQWLVAMANGLTIQGLESGFIASPEYYAKAGGSDAAWVRQLYRHVLGREAASAEVNAWVSALAAGGNRYTVAMGFVLSTERLSTVVNGYYIAFLRRSIDPTGRAAWVAAVQGGVRTEEIIAGILASNEYFLLSQRT